MGEERRDGADPLKVLSLPDVIRRTGYSRRQIFRWLADDRTDKRPNRNFPAPLRTPHNRLEWREVAFLEWFQKHTAPDKEKVVAA